MPKARDPRFITIRRGGIFTAAGHRRLALWGRRAQSTFTPLRVGALRRPAAPPSDRADSGLDVRGDHNDAVPRRRWARHGGGKNVARNAAYAAGQAAMVAEESLIVQTIWGLLDHDLPTPGNCRYRWVQLACRGLTFSTGTYSAA